MTDGDKIAAAILAVEASKQKHASNPAISTSPKFNVATDLLRHYRSMLAEIQAETR